MGRSQQQESATNAPDSLPFALFSARSARCRINYSLTKLADC
jgi:hypothetical protein